MADTPEDDLPETPEDGAAGRVVMHPDGPMIATYSPRSMTRFVIRPQTGGMTLRSGRVSAGRVVRAGAVSTIGCLLGEFSAGGGRPAS